MKIDELADRVRAMDSSAGAYKYSNEIKVAYNSIVIINIPYNAKNMFDCLFKNQDLEIPAYIKAQLARIINKFLRTPIKERYPEKKYRLRWVDDNDGTSNYLDYLAGEWRLFANEDVHIFTETELQQLKINNPRLAPAIDAMKEPVEDD